MSKNNYVDNYNKKEDEENNEKYIGSYIIGKTIGEGTFGKVKLATHKFTNENVAIKILDKSKMEEEDDVLRVQQEISILKRLKHKNIVQLYEIVQTRKYIYLILDYAQNGELFEYISNKKRLTEIESCKFFQDIINGMEYLHQQNIAHRDLKPENLLLDHKKSIKITDFGLSTNYTEGKLLKTPCGTPSYAPPEMLRGELYHGMYSDIWSSGIILYAMLVGYLPFSESSNDDIVCERIIQGKFDIPSHLSNSAADLINKILTNDPYRRINLEQIREHPWFNLLTPNICQGIILNYHRVPIDYHIISLMKKYNFDNENITKSVLNNKHDTLTATYYLTLGKFLREGGKSNSDLSSKLYLDYINDKMNILDNTKEFSSEPIAKKYDSLCSPNMSRQEIKQNNDQTIHLVDKSLNIAEFHRIFSERHFPRQSSFVNLNSNKRSLSDKYLNNLDFKKLLWDLSKRNTFNNYSISSSPIQQVKIDKNQSMGDLYINQSISMISFDNKNEDPQNNINSNARTKDKSILERGDNDALKNSLIEDDKSSSIDVFINGKLDQSKVKRLLKQQKDDINKMRIAVDFNNKIREKNKRKKVSDSCRDKKETMTKKEVKKRDDSKWVQTKDKNYFSNISGTYIDEDIEERSVEKPKKTEILQKMFKPLIKTNNKRLNKFPVPPKNQVNPNNIMKILESPKINNNVNVLCGIDEFKKIYRISESEEIRDLSKGGRISISDKIHKSKVKIKEVFASNKDDVFKKLDKIKEEMENSRKKFKFDSLSLKSKLSLSTQNTLTKRQSNQTIEKVMEKPNSPSKIKVDSSTKKSIKMQFNHLFNKERKKHMI